MAKRKRPWVRRIVWICVGLLVTAFIFAIVSALFDSGIKTSPETTFITGPLREDGTVDYVAALNEMCSEGVTPENNAAVLLVQAFGLDPIPGEIRERFFQRLGVPWIPMEGHGLERFEAYFEREALKAAPKGEEPADPSEAAGKQYEQIMERPWSKEEFPVAARWLAENGPQIDLVVAASKRPRCYVPLVAEPDRPGTLLSVPLPLLEETREAARCLRIRAMHRIHSGQIEEAWQDLLACHRLARLVSQRPTLVDGLVAIAIDGIATEGDAVLGHEGKLTAEQARRFAAEYRKLPPMGKLAEKLNVAERYSYLDGVCGMARLGPAESMGPDWLDHPSSASDWLLKIGGGRLVDWNEPLRMGNQWLDRLVAAASKPAGKERKDALAEFGRDLGSLDAEIGKSGVLFRRIVSEVSVRRALGRHWGTMLLAMFLPASSSCLKVEDRVAVLQDLVPVVFALAAYRADHGEYPKDLAALAPKYLPAVPQDLFSGGPIRYKREDGGYVVYSVGQNGKDDGGRASWEESDSEQNPDHDDIAIRVPVKKK